MKLAIIEDEEAHFQLMKRSIAREFPGASISHFDEATSCFEAINKACPDLIIVDYLMPGMTGIEFLEKLNRSAKDIPIIMVTGQGDENIAVQAIKLGAWDYVVKTADFFTLLPSAIEKVLRERKLKDSLREVEGRFKDLADSSSDWIWEMDAQGRYTYSNPAVKRILGYDSAEIIGTHFAELFPERSGRARREEAVQIMRDGKPITGFATSLFDKNGREVVLETSGIPIFDIGGNLTGFRGIDRDITRRKIAERALGESEEKFRTIYEKSPIGIQLYDEYGQLLNANQACLDIFGVSSFESISKFNLFDDPNIPEEVFDRFCIGETVRYEGPFDFGKVRELDLFETRKSGIIHIDIQITPLGQDGCFFSGFLVQVQDISDRMHAEEALRVSHHFLEIANKITDLPTLLKEFVAQVGYFSDCAAVAIRTLDEAGKIPYVASKGFSPEFFDLENPLSILADQCMCISVIRGDVDQSKSYYTSGGSFFMNETSRFLASLPKQERDKTRNVCNEFGFESVALIPIRLGESILGLIHIADPREGIVPRRKVEILERAAMELGIAIHRLQTGEELRKAHDELEHRVRERTLELAVANERLLELVEERKKVQEALEISSEKFKIFAYSIMHDLKSPTIGIHGLTRLLQKQCAGLLDDRAKIYCEQILKASEQSSALVEKINAYIASKEAPLCIETISTQQLLQTIREEFSERLELRGIRWSEPARTIEVRADRISMLRVFRNLVDNALKYGGDQLSEIAVEYADDGSHHIFSVSDNGVGIKEEDSKRVFDLFQRNSVSQGIPGAGLGLSIVREIAERHSGKVWVASRPGGGTIFYISISKTL